jgi:REP element-mobilizing transposase RayT
MPRCARVKNGGCTYHVMARSISDIPLFKCNKDKDRYLSLLKKYQDIFMFKVYAYCIMDTHAHMLIYANGADISKIMHGVNQSYAQYYNRRYNRHGHVFQDRFKSIIVDNDRYLLTVSAYIHNNPLSIKRYNKCIGKYPYSSMGVYLGVKEDVFDLLDTDFILGMISSDTICARIKYKEFTSLCTNEDKLPSMEFMDEQFQYRSGKRLIIRNFNIDDITAHVSEGLDLRKVGVNIKNNRRLTGYRALCVMLLRSLCNLKCKDICSLLGNITQARVSSLCSKGYELISSDERYRRIVEELIEKYSAA